MFVLRIIAVHLRRMHYVVSILLKQTSVSSVC